MSKPRVQMNAVILPNGKVLAIGGSLTNEDTTSASLQADLFNPTTEKWSPAGVCAYPRLYHSVALLMPDATVWVAGGNPVRGEYEPHMEIYTPAYLFTTNASGAVISATRPTITSVPAEIGYGATFAIQTPNAASIGTVVLMRPGASSHAFDMEQRLVGLSFTVSAPGTLTATAPPHGFIAPPGYYMLFILNNAGVPSVAKFVHLTSTPTDQPPVGTITISRRRRDHSGRPVRQLSRQRDRSRRPGHGVFMDIPGGNADDQYAAISGPRHVCGRWHECHLDDSH